MKVGLHTHAGQQIVPKNSNGELNHQLGTIKSGTRTHCLCHPSLAPLPLPCPGTGSPLGRLPPELLERVVNLAVPKTPTSLHLDLPSWMAMGGVDGGQSSDSDYDSDEGSDDDGGGIPRMAQTWRSGVGGGGGGGADLMAAARCI